MLDDVSLGRRGAFWKGQGPDRRDPSKFLASGMELRGRFLREKEEHPKMGATGWPEAEGLCALVAELRVDLTEAPWLRQWATHAPLSAYLGSRLEAPGMYGHDWDFVGLGN